MILPVFLPHLGCGQRCSYCNQTTITDSPFGGRDFGKLGQLLESQLSKLREPAEIALYGGNPCGLGHRDLTRLLSSFDPYRPSIASIRISTKPQTFTTEVIETLQRYRVRTVELGAPCFNEGILARLSRGHTVEDIFTACDLLRNSGFRIGLQVMVGLPGERAADIRRTAEEVIRLAPDFIRIYPLVVIEETPLFKDFLNGEFEPDTVETATAKAAYLHVQAWAHGVQTIKMGLTGNPGLGKSVVAGPYHPAFGYLVRSEAFYRAVVGRCRQSGLSGSMEVHVASADVPHLIGEKRRNLRRLAEEGVAVRWLPEPGARTGYFSLETAGRKENGSLSDGLATFPF